MAEYLVRTDKSVRLDEILHLHGIHHYAVQRLGKHGRLGDLDALIESLWCEQEDVYAEQIIKSAPTIVEANNE